MDQLLTHILGDYVFQSDYFALNKSKRSWPCLLHVLIYTACFLILTTSWKALIVIGVTHFIIDRWHTPLKKFIWLRGHLSPKFSYPPYEFCDTTGYYDDSPYNTGKNGPQHFAAPQRIFSISIFLYIVHDNFLHLLINYLALKYLT